MIPMSSRARLVGLSGRAVTKSTWFHIASAIALVTGSTDAHAQSMDYGALEQLFGEPVTTSATGSPQRASDVPANMEIVTQDDIRRSGAYDIPGVLRHVAGVDVLQWTNDQADVGLNGYNQAYSPRLLVLVDGRQVYADYYGYTPWSNVPVEMGAIRQIEVVKGPSSALFGFNAVDGVINIVTHNPQFDDVNTVAVTGGTQDLAQGSAVATVKLGDAAFRLSGGGRVNKDFTTPVPPPFGNTRRMADNRGAVDLNGVIRLNDKMELGIEASHSSTDQNEVDPAYTLASVKKRMQSVKGQLTADTGVGLLKATAYRNWLTADELAGPPFGAYHFNNQLTVVQVEDVFKLGADHTFRASAEYRHTTMNTTPVTGADVFYDIYSVGAMWEWKVAPPVSLTNAVRADTLMFGRTGSIPPGYPFTNADWNRSTTQMSFNSGLVWKPGTVDTIRLTASRGVQIPNLIATGGFVAITPFFSVGGTPALGPSVTMNYEIGWDHALPAINARAHANIFHQTINNLLSIVGGFIPTASSGLATPAYVGNSRATGGEFGVTGHFLENWRWGANIRYEAVDDRLLPAAVGGTQFVDFQHTTPRVLANANLGWAHGKWEIDGFVRFQSRSRGLETLLGSLGSTRLVQIPAYTSTDGRIGYKITEHVTLAISGQNLTASSQQQTSGPAVERRVLGTLTVSVP
ncbi:MAG: TonB-dependent receptor [Rhodospirillaceae bacterium]|nr:MAG: TonB-dependent receptor [Rhodospirillaceae bacterium]